MMLKVDKKNKIILLTIVIVIISLSLGYIYMVREYNLFTRGMASSSIRVKGNNEFTFNIGVRDLIHDYANIMLKLDESVNIKEPLEFEIIDGKGNVVERGKLEEDKIFRESYKLNKGQWKIRFNIKEENQKAYINFGYNINSTKENTSRVS